MAVLAEAISVIMRCETIETRYPGGWEGYVKDAPNKNLCTDGRLARVGFMSPYDATSFVSRLEQLGFEFVRDGKAVDVCVVDQLQGPASRCEWLECLHMDISGDGETICVAVCREAGDQSNDVYPPETWKIHDSLSRNCKFIPNENVKDRLELIRHENGLDVFRDRTTGKIFYMGRTSPLLSVARRTKEGIWRSSNES